MYWQRKRLHTESAVDANTTYRYRLPEVGLYSAFSVEVKAQRYANRAAVTAQPHLFESITKIEMLHDGTSVVKSLRGGELLALNAFDFKRIPPYQHQERADGWNHVPFYLLAGRTLQDKEYCFDMSRLGSPTLEITNVLTETLAEYWKVDTLKYEIYGWRAVGSPQPRPRGFFRCNERVYYTTSAANAEKAIDITPGKLIRRILLKGWTVSTTPGGHLSKVELEVNEGEYSPVVISSIMEWCLQNAVDYGLNFYQSDRVFLPTATSLHVCETFMGYYSHPSVTVFTEGQTSPIRCSASVGGTVQLRPDTTGGATLGINGVAYQRALLIGFDIDPNLEDMFDARGLGKIKLILTEAAADKVVSVAVEELITY